jgi:hypothetical protein
MSHKGTALVAMLGAIAVAAAVAGTGGDEESPAPGRYTVDCKILMATDNEPIPPTLFGRYPSKGYLTFVAAGEVTNGKLGSTRLDGTKFALFGRAPNDWKRGKSFDNLSLYLDDGATPQQRRAMGMILRVDDAFRAEGTTPLSTVKIAIERSSKDALAPTAIKVGTDGDRGEVMIQPMKGNDGVRPVALENAFTFFDEREAVGLATASIRFADLGRELKATNVSGEIHSVRLNGTIHGLVEESSSR